MKDGFIKAAAAAIDVRVADCIHNTDEIIKKARELSQKGARILVFPELSITGYTCQDLFWQETLLGSAREQLLRAAEELKDVPGLIFVGLPYVYHGKLYNVAAAINQGEILGLVPKEYLPNYGEFYEARHFSSGKNLWGYTELGGKQVPVMEKLLFSCREMPGLYRGCGDLRGSVGGCSSKRSSRHGRGKCDRKPFRQ